MFKFEKEMIPILKEQLSKMYNTNYFIQEFDSGNGVADLVFTTEILNKKTSGLDYQLIFVILKYFNRKNKKVEIEKFYKETFLTKKQAFNLINYLEEIGVIEKINDKEFFIKEKYNPPIKKIISIEAKLFDWKGGFYQALRYKTYSNKSYLAISEEYAHRVDIDLLKEHNIGLIIVGCKKIDIKLDVKNEKPINNIAHAYLAEKFVNLTFA